jgi:uncharacterized BrkB/YihY/UPF0761 family membrane protein
VFAPNDLLARADTWQRAHRVVAVTYGVVKKFGDDNANQLVVALGWYGFVAIYPLLLAVVTIFGFIGAASLGHQLVTTLHQFPVVGAQFNPAPASSSLHGSALGLTFGLVGLVYGAQGVTQTVQQAMASVWNVPQLERPAFLPRLARSLAGLTIIGGAFLLNAALATLTTATGTGYAVRVPVLIGLALVNTALYLAAFRTLTPPTITARTLVPGAAVAAVGFTLLTTLGAGLVQHQVRHSSATYGQFGIVIGLVAFLFLLAKISLYGAELNPVLARSLWPRALQSSRPTEADDRVLRDIAHQTLGRQGQRIGVGFGMDAREEVARDAESDDRPDDDRSSASDHGPSHGQSAPYAESR